MSLKGLSSVLSSDGSPAILLMHRGSVTESLPIVRATKEHRSFILSTWIRSYESQARRMGIGDLYRRHEPAVAESRWGDCWVLTDSGGFTVISWICGSNGQLWHVYVVPELRQLRVATRMIEYACGGLKEYQKPWPYSAHGKVNPYLNCVKNG